MLTAYCHNLYNLASGIYVEEDFSRAAKFRRKELEKFAKEVKALSSDKKCIFKYELWLIDLIKILMNLI